jgi:hypothetical protein
MVNTAQLIAKALIALYGSILFWVGLWTSLDVDFSKRSLQRDLCYTFVGLGLMVGADSFYSNAGVDGRFVCLRCMSVALLSQTPKLLRHLSCCSRFQKGKGLSYLRCSPCHSTPSANEESHDPCHSVHGPRCARKAYLCGAGVRRCAAAAYTHGTRGLPVVLAR